MVVTMNYKFLPLLIVSCFSASSVLAEPTELGSSTDWDIDITAYAFIPVSTQGTSTIAGSSIDLDLDLQDALDLLNFAMSARLEAWKGDFGLILDTNYLSLSAGGSTTLPGPITASVDVDIKQAWLGLLAGYRVAEGTYGKAGRRYSFDIQGGVRYNSLEQTVTATGTGPAAGTVLGGTETWLEPTIGVRGLWSLSDEWTTFVMADAGGFGVNGDRLQWSATLGFDYSPWENGSLKFGWRYYGIDFSTTRSDGVFAYDVIQNGPIFGYTHQF